MTEGRSGVFRSKQLWMPHARGLVGVEGLEPPVTEVGWITASCHSR